MTEKLRERFFTSFDDLNFTFVLYKYIIFTVLRTYTRGFTTVSVDIELPIVENENINRKYEYKNRHCL